MPKFEHATGYKLAIAFATLGEIVKRIQDGESADVVIIPSRGLIAWSKTARLRQAT